MKASELVTFNEDGSVTCNFDPPQDNKCRHPLKMAITDGLYKCGWCHAVIPESAVLQGVA